MSANTTYTVIGTKFEGTMIFKYDLNGDLVHFELKDINLNEKQKNWLYNLSFPFKEKQMVDFNNLKNMSVIRGEPNTSFDYFYNLFGVKVKKARAEQLWNKLSHTDRLNCLASIKAYKRWLSQRPGIAQQQPDTYIRQQRWLDEFN